MKQTRLQELLEYAPETGVFRWRVNRTSVRAGTMAGRLDSKGYRQISVDGQRYGAHRLAWLYMNGEWPKHEIDHVNGDRDDNRIANLRDVVRTINMRNKRRYSNAANTPVGIQRRSGVWHSYIGNSYIGAFVCLGAAFAARRAAESQLDYHANHGRA